MVMRYQVPIRPLLNRGQAARFLGVSPDLLARWEREGIGPAIIRYNAKVVRYDLAVLEVFQASHGGSELPSGAGPNVVSLADRKAGRTVAPASPAGGPRDDHRAPTVAVDRLRHDRPDHRPRWPADPAEPGRLVRRHRQGRIPKPICVGGRAVWKVAEIDALIARLAADAPASVPRATPRSRRAAA